MSHAVIRIVSFFILAFFLARGDNLVIGIIFLITCLLYIIDPPHNFSNLLRNIVKMKWFFISIFLVYLFFNNGSGHEYASESRLSLLAGAERVLILIIMLFLVGWLIRKTPRNDLISALITLLRPLSLTGFPLEVMALRIELVLRNIDVVQSALVKKRESFTATGFKVRETGKIMSGVFSDVLSLAESDPLQSVELHTKPAPSCLQWMLPICLFSILFLITSYS